MKKLEHKRVASVATTLATLALLSVQSIDSSASNTDKYRYDRPHHSSHKKPLKRIIRGVAVTGHNDVLGQPFFDWGEPFGSFGFYTLGIYNENGNEPLLLSEDVPDSALVATALDPNLLASTGVSQDQVDPDWLNLPLRDVPVQYSYGKTKVFPGIFDADHAEKSQSDPIAPITLGQWMSAEGTAKIVCSPDGTSSVQLRMKNLIPNRLYGVWATLGQSSTGEGEVFPSIPIGGTPNLFITDKNGEAVYERDMQFCMLDPDSTDRDLLVINIQYHSNHQNYGGINGPPLENIEGGYWIGSVIHNHIQFPVNVELLE